MNKGTIFIASAIMDAWGGSEELWSETVPFLRQSGYHVTVCKHYIDRDHPKIARHIREGIEFLPTSPPQPFVVRACRKIIGKTIQLLRIDLHKGKPGFALSYDALTFKKYLREYRPKLVLISQGVNFDGLGYAHACLDLDIPYVIVSHKAVDFYWPPNHYRSAMRTVLLEAARCYFVSNHNKQLTEEQFGVRLPNAEVIFNPVKPTEYIPYPNGNGSIHLCCIGRLFAIEKGQDMLIRVLSQQKWKDRSVKVSIIGTGPDEDVLKEMATLLESSNVSFRGHVDNVYEMWSHSHALVMPSRTEGLPLVIVEAMMAGRPVITTDVGGNKELLKEGETGFISYAHDESLDATLERAWANRTRWKDMGKRAAETIRETIPPSPERIFADKLLSFIRS